MSNFDPTPEEIDLSLMMTSTDTINSEIRPGSKEFKTRVERIKAFELGVQNPKGSTFDNLEADLETLLGFIPPIFGNEVKSNFFKLKSALIYSGTDWQALYKTLENFFTEKKGKRYGSTEEQNFWITCWDKYMEIKKRYFF